MNLTITGRHVPITSAIREYVTKRFEKLDHFRTKLETARVILWVERQRQVCETVLAGKNLRLTAKESAPDLYAAVDLTVDKLVRQLRRVKEKTHEDRHKHRRGRSRVVEPEFLPAPPMAETTADPDEPVRIDLSSRFATKPMTPEEAAWQLAASKDEFLVFHDAAAGRTSVIYRKGDGRFGLIAPDFGSPRPRGGSARP